MIEFRLQVKPGLLAFITAISRILDSDRKRMRHDKSPQRLAKFLAYLTGRRPDEFGLLPDAGGFLKIREVLKVMGEEAEWRYVRRAHLEEVRLTVTSPPIEIEGNRVRAVRRDGLPVIDTAPDLPKLLYTSIRQRAWPRAHARGLTAPADSTIRLFADRERSLQIGKRIDPAPVLLTIHVGKAMDGGTTFSAYGETLFLARSVPADAITGPPLPKPQPETRKSIDAEAEPRNPPGGFYLDVRALNPADKKKGKKKEIAWKRDRKRHSRR